MTNFMRMMRTNTNTFISLLILAASLAFGAIFISSAQAQSLKGITFPIAELGNCGSIGECKNYCDIPKLEQHAIQSTVKRGFPTKPIIDRSLDDRAFPIGKYLARITRHAKRITKGKILYKVDINRPDGAPYTLIEWRDKTGRVVSRAKPNGGANFRGFAGLGFQKAENFPFTVKVLLQNGEKNIIQIFLNRTSFNKAGPLNSGGITEDEILKRKKACDDFAIKHNLGNAKKRKKKLEVIEKDGGPGGCALNSNDPFASCQAFCGLPDNMRACINWAKSQKDKGITIMTDRELEDAEKIVPLLERGEIELPAGCTNMNSCKSICQRPPTPEIAEQCFEIARKAGFLPPGVNPEKARKMFQAAQRGEIDFDQMEKCEDPPDDATFQKCIEIGEKYGLIPEKDLEIIKKTGGKGPGDCRGRKECEEFCNNPVNQEICFNFAEEHGLIPPEELEKARGGIGEIKNVLRQAPPEVKQCLINAIGQDLITQIESGNVKNLFALKDLRGPMENCFTKFGGFGGPGGPSDRGRPGIPPEFLKCLTDKGINPQNIDRSNPSPAVIECFGKHGGPGEEFPVSPGGPAGVNVKVEKGPLGLKVTMNVPGGILEFSMAPQEGSNYGGELSGCPKRNTRDVPLRPPLKITIKTCAEQTYEFAVKAPGVFSKGAQGGAPGSSNQKFQERTNRFPGPFPGESGGPRSFSKEAGECMEKLGLRLTGPPTSGQQAQIEKCVRESATQERKEEERKMERERKHERSFKPEPQIPSEVLQQLQKLRLQFPEGIPNQILKQFETRGFPNEFLDKFRSNKEGPPSQFKSPPVDVVCPTNFDPVCGIDGRTYSNECRAKTADVSIAKPGECQLNKPQIDPVRECEAKGGKWSGEKCEFPPESSPSNQPPPPSSFFKDECIKRGGLWENNICISDPALICTKKGGKWDASAKTCKLAQFTPPSLLNFFARILGIAN